MIFNTKTLITKEKLDEINNEIEKLKKIIKEKLKKELIVEIKYENENLEKVFLDIIAINLSNSFNTKISYDYEKKCFKELEEYLILNNNIDKKNIKDYEFENENLLVYMNFIKEPVIFKTQKVIFKKDDKLTKDVNSYLKNKNTIVAINNLRKEVVFYYGKES